MQVTAVWTDGTIDRADTFEALLEQTRRDQWHRFTRWGFRRELAKRARALTGQRVKRRGSAEQFMRRLEAAGALRLEVEE